VLQRRHLDFSGFTAHCVLKRYLEGVTQIRASLRPLTSTTAATKNIAKDITENIAEATTLEATATHLWINARVTVLIVGLTLLAIAENFISLGGLFEFLVSIGVIRITVRVILHRNAPIGLFNVLCRC